MMVVVVRDAVVRGGTIDEAILVAVKNSTEVSTGETDKVGGVVGGVGVGLVVRTEVEGETVVDEAEMEGEISVKVAVVTIGVSNDLIMEISVGVIVSVV